MVQGLAWVWSTVLLCFLKELGFRVSIVKIQVQAVFSLVASKSSSRFLRLQLLVYAAWRGHACLHIGPPGEGRGIVLGSIRCGEPASIFPCIPTWVSYNPPPPPNFF